MRFVIEYRSQENTSGLFTSSKQRQLTGTLFFIHKGSAVIHLGKHDYLLTANQAFWLPIQCLNAVSYLPQTLWSRLDCSVRITHLLPQQAGYANPSILVNVILQQLYQDNTIKKVTI